MANLLWLQRGTCSDGTTSFQSAEEPRARDRATDFGIDASTRDVPEFDPMTTGQASGWRPAKARTPSVRLTHLTPAKERLGRELPDRLTVYQNERQSLEFGIGLSDPVERAVEHVMELLVDRVER